MEKKKSGALKYVIIIVSAVVLFCAIVALLLHRDSAKFATKQLALKYYEYITKDDAKSMEKLFIDVDRKEIVKAADGFDNYFKGIGKSLVSQYGAGYSVTIENLEYTDFDNQTKMSFSGKNYDFVLIITLFLLLF